MPRRKSVQTAVGAPKPVKPSPIGPLPSSAAILETLKDFPRIDVLTRRFLNPNLPGSLPILLKDEPANACTNSEHMNRIKPGAATCAFCGKPPRLWYVRWMNLGKDNRSAEMRALGYVGVEISELTDANDIADLYRSKDDVYVRRGDAGKEILAKLPLVAYNYIKAKQREQWNASVMKGKKLQDSLAEAAGNELGDEAGQRISDGAIKVESFKRTTTTLGEESGVEIDA